MYRQIERKRGTGQGESDINREGKRDSGVLGRE